MQSGGSKTMAQRLSDVEKQTDVHASRIEKLKTRVDFTLIILLASGILNVFGPHK